MPASPLAPAAAAGRGDAELRRARALAGDRLHLATCTWPRTRRVASRRGRRTCATPRADAVFILGDLFEVWVGDDMAERGFEARCVEVLREAAAARHRRASWPATATSWSATRCSSRAASCASPIRPWSRVRRARRCVSHGDALCVDDVAYQRYRAVVRRPALQRAFGACRFAARRAIGRSDAPAAARAPRRGASRRASSTSTPARRSRGCGAPTRPTLVHGHTHAPASHALAPGSARHVLSDWELDGGQRAARRGAALERARLRAHRAGRRRPSPQPARR